MKRTKRKRPTTKVNGTKVSSATIKVLKEFSFGAKRKGEPSLMTTSKKMKTSSPYLSRSKVLESKDTLKSTPENLELKPCIVCNESFSSSDDLKCHLAKHAGCMVYRCNVCSQTFITVNKWKEHIEDSVGTSHCEMCGQNFGCITAKQGHQCSDFMYVCFECSSKFRKKWALDRHLRTHHCNKKCSVCNMKFANEDHFENHTKKCSLNENKASNSELTSDSKTTANVKNHKGMIKTVLKAQNSIPKSKLPEKNKKEQNSEDEKSAEKKSLLPQPELGPTSVEETLITVKQQVETSSNCIKCGLEASNELKISPGKACICSKNAVSNNVIKVIKKAYTPRMSIIEDDVTQKILSTRVVFECKKCFKVYRSEKQLELHKKVHTSLPATRCTTCKQFFCKKNHGLRTQLGVKPKVHTCVVCNANFVMQRRYAIHEAKHFGTIRFQSKKANSEPLYSCHHCNKEFGLKLFRSHYLRRKLKPSVLKVTKDEYVESEVDSSSKDGERLEDNSKHLLAADKVDLSVHEGEESMPDLAKSIKESNTCSVEPITINQQLGASDQNLSENSSNQLEATTLKELDSTLEKGDSSFLKYLLLATNSHLQEYLDQSGFKSLLKNGLVYRCPLCKKAFKQYNSILNHTGLCWYFYFGKCTDGEISEEEKSLNDILNGHMPPMVSDDVHHVGIFVLKNLCDPKEAVAMKKKSLSKASWLNKENCSFRNIGRQKVNIAENSSNGTLNSLQELKKTNLPTIVPPSLPTDNHTNFKLPFVTNKKLLSVEIKKRVSVVTASSSSPHECWICGRMFTSNRGILNHYLMHVNTDFFTSTSQLQKNTDSEEEFTADTQRQDKPETTLQLAENESEIDSSSKLQEVDESCNRSTDDDDDENKQKFDKLQDLRSKFSKLLCHLVGDPEVLSDLGWPQRLIDEVLVDVIKGCDQSPAISTEQTPLENLRLNITTLLHICVKDQAMEKFGWNMKPVEEVVGEMLSGGDISGI